MGAAEKLALEHARRGGVAPPTTVVRSWGNDGAWMTATQGAFSRSSPLLGLDEGETFELVVRFERLAPEVLAGQEPFAWDPFGVFARTGIEASVSLLDEGTVEATVRTAEPEAAFERIRAALPVGAERHVVAGFRSGKIAPFTGVWPRGVRFRAIGSG